MPGPERIFNFAMGLSVLGWATGGTWSNLGHRPFAVLAVTSLLHLIVGYLFLVRSLVEKQGDLRTWVIAIPAVLVGGWVFRFSPSQWNWASQILFVAGGAWAILSFAFLGRCFAVLPAIRGTVTRGPFAYIRHPIYLGELAMVVACLVAAPMSRWQVLILAFALALFVLRIRAEEGLLLTTPAYQAYCRRVRWRLLPLLW